MRLKRQKFTRETLDEMSRTMSVIPTSELMSMYGEGGSSWYLSDECALISFLSSKSSEDIEVMFVRFFDGTYLAYIDDSNKSNYATMTLLRDPNTGYYYTSEGKWVVSIGHSHGPNDTSDPSDDDLLNMVTGLPHSIYKGGYFHPY